MNSKNVKIGIIVAFMGTAALLFMFRSNSAEPVPDTPETAVQYKCRVCHKVFDLTPTKIQAAVEKAGQDAPLFCEACGAKEAYRVSTCDKCGEQFFGPEVPGSSGACPKCFPATVAPRVVIQPDEAKEETPTDSPEQVGPPKVRVVPNY